MSQFTMGSGQDGGQLGRWCVSGDAQAADRGDTPGGDTPFAQRSSGTSSLSVHPVADSCWDNPRVLAAEAAVRVREHRDT